MPPKAPSLREHADAWWRVLRRPWKAGVIAALTILGWTSAKWLDPVLKAAAPLAPAIRVFAAYWGWIIAAFVVVFLAAAWRSTRALYRDLGYYASHGVLWRIYAHKLQPGEVVVEGPYCPNHRTRLLWSPLAAGVLFARDASAESLIGLRPGRREFDDESGYLYCPEAECGFKTLFGLEPTMGWTTLGSVRREVKSKVESRLASWLWRLRRRLPGWTGLARD